MAKPRPVRIPRAARRLAPRRPNRLIAEKPGYRTCAVTSTAVGGDGSGHDGGERDEKDEPAACTRGRRDGAEKTSSDGKPDGAPKCAGMMQRSSLEGRNAMRESMPSPRAPQAMGNMMVEHADEFATGARAARIDAAARRLDVEARPCGDAQRRKEEHRA